MPTTPITAVVNLDVPGPTISRHVYGHFAEHLGAAVPEHEDYETLAGLVTLHLGRLAEVGDRVTVAAAPAPGEPEATITFEVTALDVHRITAVHARVHRPADVELDATPTAR